MPDRKNFGDVFGDKPNKARPEVTLRRFTDKDAQSYGMVGIYWGRDLIAQVQFDDLFDEEGNRFYND